jgi:hypothetical protein
MRRIEIKALIRDRAYEIWNEEGRPDGRDRIHWLRAEAEWRDARKAASAANRAALRAKRLAAPSPVPFRGLPPKPQLHHGRH